ncbi:hypothetical protein EJ05DRAFT_507375 [Pseudovirgaria hyperparasitica]|uniref:ADP-ribosylation factor n=1 Tax=Pseudovirgaria hyperparasitica TaxID=470096 RepID=A0A6A6WFY5_9PEZI|nr:uncharacterized protein EJ05DRAFT_507375 [Pseudovirgaria hyperparasitica]KAF2761742.1 hypothetical protein EJ05DRAFT_507375 [Pseudovirgaria hyperparasitica]
MEASLEPESLSGALPDYYQDIENLRIRQRFKDFDDPKNYERFDLDVRNPDTKNLVVDFGDDEAYCASNLNSNDIADILDAPRPPSLHTRWINIWMPYKQKDTLHNIAKVYDFSPRLLAVMVTDPIRVAKPNVGKSHSSLIRRLNPRKSSKETSVDLEKSLDGIESVEHSILGEPEQLTQVENHYQIAHDVWHWSTVDWGRRFVCIGYNSLYPITSVSRDRVAENSESKDLPEGIRVWTWLILTVDKTVISIREDPFPYHNGIYEVHEMRSMLTIRRNLINVFRQLSKVHDSSHENAMTILPIRRRIGETVEETAHRPTDAPGLLFFYLFEDWFSAFNLVARREHRYAAELNKLREEMLVKAELFHIDRLHHIGRQLAVLKRLYQSYELLIERVLEKQEATLASMKNSHIASGLDSLQSSRHQIMEAESLLGVSLSSAAKVRFARLRTAIRLYALSEMQECLDQKESLVMMNFNLIAIKESFSVERLTRITLLLAKVTLLFMPVSLMTAYFGSEFVNADFTVKQYWIWFGVILGTSIFALMIFSFASGTMEGRILYRPLTRRIFDAISKQFKRHGTTD